MKSTKTIMVILAVFFAGILSITSCKHESFLNAIPTPVPGSTGITCSIDSVYFANDILPLINSGCATSGCHDNITHAEGVRLTNYTQIMKYVSSGNASNSKLYKVLVQSGNDRMPQPPRAAFTTAQISMVQKWINQGAKNNGCDKCDTIDFKYSTAIKPLVQTKCQGCHNSSSPGGNIDLSTYTGVKAVATNGKLFGSVNWSSGFSAMPKNSVKMPACEITQIRKWVDAGAPNN